MKVGYLFQLFFELVLDNIENTYIEVGCENQTLLIERLTVLENADI